MLSGHAADRTAFLKALDAAVRRDRESVAVVRVDLDRFSRIRQVHGPAASRMVLATLWARLEQIAGGAHDHVLRFGEDAFMAIVHVSDTSPDVLEAAGLAIIDAMSAPITSTDAPPIAVGSNVGIAVASHFDDSDALRLLAGAELAVQQANELGSRRVVVYEVARRGDPTRFPRLYADMLGAIRDGQFHADYQPIVSLPGARIVGAEALVRWIHPSHGVLLPGEFMVEAEKSGLIRDIDAQVRRLACSALAGWPADVCLTVNLSAADLDAPDLAEDVAAVLSEAGLPAHRLVLEITETALAQEWSRARRRLESLKELGVRLAVDDFGSGHMFLDRLSTGLFDVLKVDRSLVTAEGDDVARSRALLMAVTAMARALGMDTVAEGIETEAQLALVLEVGCDRAQGFLFARPMSAADVGAQMWRRSS